MRVLVTGAGGILGRAVVGLIGSAGWTAFPVMRPNGTTTFPTSVSIDLTETRLFGNVPQVEAVVHLAAAVPHNREYRDDPLAGRLTGLIDKNVSDYVDKTGAYVIYSSGCSLYDNTDAGWKSENSAVCPKSDYQRSKYLTEQTLLKKSSACVFRSSTPCGPGIFISTVLARFIDRARQDRPLEVWGRGTREQDFVHAEDVAQFVLMALNRRAKGLYNVASGHPITMEQLAELVVNVIGKGKVVRTGQADPQNGASARFLINKAQAELGWVPNIQLADIVRQCQTLSFRE